MKGDDDGRFQDARPHRRRQGQAGAGPGRPQRADGRRQGDRRDPHRARGADNPGTSDKGAKVVLLAHFGRPKDGPSTRILARAGRRAASEIIGRKVTFIADCIGEKAAGAIFAMMPGDIAASRKHPLLQGRGEERPGLHRKARRQWRHLRQRRVLGRAPRALLDRGPRRSPAGLRRPHHAGRTRRAGKGSRQPGRPVVAIVGGAKISSKLDLLMNLVKKVDALVIGGGMANTFLAARGDGCRQVALRARSCRRPRGRS